MDWCRHLSNLGSRGVFLPDVEQIVAGLHEKYANRIYFVALRELRSHAAAEDACNETLIRVMQAVRSKRIAEIEALPGFVSSTARNVIHEFRRKDSRAGQLGDQDFAAPGPDPFLDPSVRQAVQKVMECLKPRERDVLRLTYYEELSKDDISARLGIIPERVRLVKSRALRSFRDFYVKLSKGARQ